MMDAYNLAVCFGPSIIDIKENTKADPVTCQANINNVIKVTMKFIKLTLTSTPSGFEILNDEELRLYSKLASF